MITAHHGKPHIITRQTLSAGWKFSSIPDPALPPAIEAFYTSLPPKKTDITQDAEYNYSVACENQPFFTLILPSASPYIVFRY